MKRRSARNGAPCDREHGGFAEFLHSLLAGIPWSESAERLDVEHVKPPRHSIKLHNSNGKTRVVGEDRDDLAGVREFPARVKCASLAWHTLNAALAGAVVVVEAADQHEQQGQRDDHDDDGQMHQ